MMRSQTRPGMQQNKDPMTTFKINMRSSQFYKTFAYIKDCKVYKDDNIGLVFDGVLDTLSGDREIIIRPFRGVVEIDVMPGTVLSPTDDIIGQGAEIRAVTELSYRKSMESNYHRQQQQQQQQNNNPRFQNSKANTMMQQQADSNVGIYPQLPDKIELTTVTGKPITDLSKYIGRLFIIKTVSNNELPRSDRQISLMQPAYGNNRTYVSRKESTEYEDKNKKQDGDDEDEEEEEEGESSEDEEDENNQDNSSSSSSDSEPEYKTKSKTSSSSSYKKPNSGSSSISAYKDEDCDESTFHDIIMDKVYNKKNKETPYSKEKKKSTGKEKNPKYEEYGMVIQESKSEPILQLQLSASVVDSDDDYEPLDNMFNVGEFMKYVNHNSDIGSIKDLHKLMKLSISDRKYGRAISMDAVKTNGDYSGEIMVLCSRDKEKKINGCRVTITEYSVLTLYTPTMTAQNNCRGDNADELKETVSAVKLDLRSTYTNVLMDICYNSTKREIFVTSRRNDDSNKGCIEVFNRNGILIRTIDNKKLGMTISMSVSPCGEYVAVITFDERQYTLLIMRSDTGSTVKSLKHESDVPCACLFTNNGDIVVSKKSGKVERYAFDRTTNSVKLQTTYILDHPAHRLSFFDYPMSIIGVDILSKDRRHIFDINTIDYTAICDKNSKKYSLTDSSVHLRPSQSSILCYVDKEEEERDMQEQDKKKHRRHHGGCLIRKCFKHLFTTITSGSKKSPKTRVCLKHRHVNNVDIPEHNEILYVKHLSERVVAVLCEQKLYIMELGDTIAQTNTK